jgi:lipopolysaccharide transport protein LptA
MGLAVGGAAAEGDVVGSTAAPKAVITSRSVRVLDKGRRVEFTGEVALTRGDDFLSTDRLVTEEATNVSRATGHVYFRQENAGEAVRWEAWGDQGVYDAEVASGTLWGNGRPARARRTPLGPGGAPGGTVDLVAPEISFARVLVSTAPGARALGRALANGGVYVKSAEDGPVARVTEMWSDRADYDGPADRFRLEGAFRPWPGLPPPGAPPARLDRPYARQVQGAERRQLRGEVIDFHPAARRLVVERAVRAQILFDPNKSAKRAGSDSEGKERKTVVPAR